MSSGVIGILGGGQLSQMLIEAAARLQLRIAVFVDSTDCPATHVSVPKEFAYDIIVGTFTKAALQTFIARCSTVIFESEFVNTTLLSEAASDTNVLFLPALSVMARFQDKLEQKKICKEHALPTAPWLVVDTAKVSESIESIAKSFNEKAVFKWSRLGYDGKGNFFLADISSQKESLIQFIENGIKAGGEIYAEQMIPFIREIAIVCTRSQDGQIIEYPVVASEQKNGICLNVKGPATSFGVSENHCESLKNIARVIGEKGNIVGTYAVEAFETKDGVLVNEIAPRVHNTGHYTQDACQTSQFENHMRAVAGLPLFDPKTASYFGMRNILGPADIAKDTVTSPSGDASVHLHWYHKKGTRPGRKLGHANVYGETKELLNTSFEQALQIEKNWIESL